MASAFADLEMTSYTVALSRTMSESEKLQIAIKKQEKKRQRDEKNQHEYDMASKSMETLGIGRGSLRAASPSGASASGLTDDMEGATLGLPPLPKTTTISASQKLISMFREYVGYLQGVLSTNGIPFTPTPEELKVPLPTKGQ